MKGNPALRTVLVLLLLAAVAYPVSRVISRSDHPIPHSPSTTPSPANHPESLTGMLRIKIAPAPLHLEVSSGGKVVLEATDSNRRGEFTSQLSLPPGSDLIVRAEWSDELPHALHAEFIPSGTNASVSRDYWSGRTMEDVLSLP